MKEVIRNGGHPLKRGDGLLELSRRLLDSPGRLDQPALGNEILFLRKVAKKTLQWLATPEEIIPGVTEATEESAHHLTVLNDAPRRCRIAAWSARADVRQSSDQPYALVLAKSHLLHRT